MAKITNVTKARKAQGNCGRCGTPIAAGDPYRHASPGFRSRKLVRCMKSTCYFRQSELTTSKLAGVYEANETLEEELAGLGSEDDVETVESYRDTAADAIEDVAEEYRTASSEWAGGMNSNEEWDEKAEEVSSYAEEIRGIDVPDPDEHETHEEWVEAVIAEFDSVMSGCSL